MKLTFDVTPKQALQITNTLASYIKYMYDYDNNYISKRDRLTLLNIIRTATLSIYKELSELTDLSKNLRQLASIIDRIDNDYEEIANQPEEEQA